MQHGRHFVGREIALAFDDFLAIAVEDDGGGPAEIFVAGGEVGAGILVGFDYDVAALQKFDDGGIAVGVGVHDVAPVAPDGFEIEEDETVFMFGVGEDLVGPRLPIQARRGGGWFLRQRGRGEQEEQEPDAKRSSHGDSFGDSTLIVRNWILMMGRCVVVVRRLTSAAKAA